MTQVFRNIALNYKKHLYVRKAYGVIFLFFRKEIFRVNKYTVNTCRKVQNRLAVCESAHACCADIFAAFYNRTLAKLKVIQMEKKDDDEVSNWKSFVTSLFNYFLN